MESIEDKLGERGIKPDSCEPDAGNEKLVCETEDGGEVEFTKEDMIEMVE